MLTPSYIIRYASSPASMTTNIPAALHVEALTPKGQRITARLRLGLSATHLETQQSMPASPNITRSENGSWEVHDVMFPAAGRWQLNFEVSEGGASERAQFEVDVR